jgi:hypothetical protein
MIISGMLLTRLNNIRDSLEKALGDVRGIEDESSALLVTVPVITPPA